MYNGQFISKSDYTPFFGFSYRKDSCWTQIIADGCLPIYSYYKGFGGPYYSCESNMDFTSESRELVYYKKGDKTWGRPLIVSCIYDTQTKSELSVFPNPTNDYLNINYNKSGFNTLTIKIYDILGELVKIENLKSDNKSINLTELKKGIYFYQVLENGRVVKADKLMVE